MYNRIWGLELIMPCMAIMCMDGGPQTDVTYLCKYLYGHEAVPSIIGKKSFPRKEKLVA